MSTLKPCPFCGDDHARHEDGEFGQQASCDPRTGCGAITEYFETEAEAAAAWNRRATPWSGLIADHIKPDSGMSWNGFNLFGDKLSIREVERLLHRAGRCSELEALYAQQEAALRTKATEADATEAQLRAALEDRDERIEKLAEALNALVDRNFTFFAGGMVGADRKITREEVLAAREALAQQHKEPSK